MKLLALHLRRKLLQHSNLTCVAVAPCCGGQVIFEEAQCIGHRPCICHARRCGNIYKNCMVWAVLEASTANIEHHVQSRGMLA